MTSPAVDKPFELVITDNKVSDNQFYTALYLNACLGITCFTAFCFLQRSKIAPMHYRFRQMSESITAKMRALPEAKDGWHSLWQWLVYACTGPDSELLQSAGLDAVVHVKVLAIGVQLFAPMALLGCFVLIPIHYTLRANLSGMGITRSQLMQLTIAALPSGSPVMWVHFVLIVLYNLYAMGVLWWHYSNFLVVRQHYLVRGDNPNYWISMTASAEVLRTTRKVKRLIEEANKEIKKQKKEKGAKTSSEVGGDVEAPPLPASPAPTGAGPVPDTPSTLLARASYLLRQPKRLAGRLSSSDSRATTPAPDTLDSSRTQRTGPSGSNSRQNSAQLPDLGWLEQGFVPTLSAAPSKKSYGRQGASSPSGPASVSSLPLLAGSAPSVNSVPLKQTSTVPLTEAMLQQKNRMEQGGLAKHMRTITEDSLEYKLEQWGSSRPNSRGGALAAASSSNLGRPQTSGSLEERPSSPFMKLGDVAQQIVGQGVGLEGIPEHPVYDARDSMDGTSAAGQQGSHPGEAPPPQQQQHIDQQPGAQVLVIGGAGGDSFPGSAAAAAAAAGGPDARGSAGGAEYNPLHNNLEALVPLPPAEDAISRMPSVGAAEGSGGGSIAANSSQGGTPLPPLGTFSSARSQGSSRGGGRQRVQSPQTPRSSLLGASAAGLGGVASTDGIDLEEMRTGSITAAPSMATSQGGALAAGDSRQQQQQQEEEDGGGDASRRSTKELAKLAVAGGAASTAGAADEAAPSWNMLGGLPLAMLNTQQRQDAEEEDENGSPAHRWWTGLPKHVKMVLMSRAPSQDGDAAELDLDPLAALAGMGVDDTRAKGQLLAKPSVRYRKTINTWNPRANWGEGGEEAVNAQHYAILVTDVQQPYDVANGIHHTDLMSRFSRLMAQIPMLFYSRRSFFCCGYPHSVVGNRESVDMMDDLDWGINRRQLAEEEANGQDVLQLQERGVQELHSVAAELDLTLHQLAASAGEGPSTPLRTGLRKLQKAQTMLRQQEEKRELIAREHSTVHLASRAASRMNMAPLGAPAGLISRTNSINSRRDLRSELNSTSSITMRPESSAVAGAYIGNPESLPNAQRAPSSVWSGSRGVRPSNDFLAFTRDVPVRPASSLSAHSMVIHSSRDSRSSRESWPVPAPLFGRGAMSAQSSPHTDYAEQFNPLYERAQGRTSVENLNPALGGGGGGSTGGGGSVGGSSMDAPLLGTPTRRRGSHLAVSWGTGGGALPEGASNAGFWEGAPPSPTGRSGRPGAPPGEEPMGRTSVELGGSLGSPRSMIEHTGMRNRAPWLHSNSPLGEPHPADRHGLRSTSPDHLGGLPTRAVSSTGRYPPHQSPFALSLTQRQRMAAGAAPGSPRSMLAAPDIHSGMQRASSGGLPSTDRTGYGHHQVTGESLGRGSPASRDSIPAVWTRAGPAAPPPAGGAAAMKRFTSSLQSTDSIQLAAKSAVGGAQVGAGQYAHRELHPLYEAAVTVHVQENRRREEILKRNPKLAQQRRDQEGKSQGRLSVGVARKVLQEGKLPGQGDPLLGKMILVACQASKLHKWDLVRWAVQNGIAQRLVEVEAYSGIVASTFRRLFPKDFDRAVPVVCHREVDLLLAKWEVLSAQMERAVMTRDRTGQDPMKRDRCCCGRQISVIADLNAQIQSVERQVDVARKEAWNTGHTPSWFVLFNSQQAASMAASAHIYTEDDRTFEVHPAPGPEEVNWQHLWLSRMQRTLRGIVVWPFLLLVVLFPITLFTSAVGRVEYLFCPSVNGNSRWNLEWTWYCDGRTRGDAVANFVRSFLTGWLPALLLNLYLVMVLPRLVYLLVQTEGNCVSLSALERRIAGIFYHWDVFNVFLQGTVGSTFFQQMWRIFNAPSELPEILGAAIPDSSNFFMQFIAMRSLFLVWLRLCIPHGGVWQNWLFKVACPATCCSMCNTERDRSLTYGPRTPRYGFEVGHILLMYLIAFAYSVVSPLIVPFSVLWFMFAWVAWRHNLSYVYQRKYESGGMMWTFIFNRICTCLVIMQLFTFCVLLVKQAYVQATLIAVFLPVLTVKFNRLARERFGSGVDLVPLNLAQKAPRAAVPSAIYIPPPLQDQSWGWYPEWNKMWDGWGMPAYGW